MNNLRNLLLAFFAIFVFGSTANAEWILEEGSGTKNDPYLIDGHTWPYLRDNVNEGITYKGKYFKLKNDIIVRKGSMLGESNHPFSGIFDGDGHTITVNIDAHGDYNLAPFRYVRGATIMNLRVNGTINAAAYAGGIVAHVSGTDNHIINCRSSVTFSFLDIYNSTSYEILSGGLVGIVDGDNNASLYIENSLFDGKFTTTKVYVIRSGWGGLVGELHGNNGEVNITNSLFAPTEIQNAFLQLVDWRCFVWGNGSNAHFTNCYYKTGSAGTTQAQGTNSANDMTQIELRTALGGAWKAEGQNAVVPVMKSIPFAGNGTSDSPYQISSDADWNSLAYLVNNGYRNFEGKFLKQMSDITASETVTTVGTPIKMVGVSESSSFQGIYDGDNHTLTVNYNDQNDDHYSGPFRFIKGATIRNLHVCGTIVKAQKKHAGGFVGQAFGTNYITNCRSSVDIKAYTDGDGSHGGFLGDLRGGTTHFENCVFDGKLQGTNTKKWGGFVGWVASGCTANFTNCLFTPTFVNVKNDDNKTYARKDGSANFTNSYYTQTLGSAQGKEACSISGSEYNNGTTVTVVPNGDPETAGSNINLTAYLDGSSYNPCIKYGDVIYSGSGNNVKLNLSQVGDTPTGAQTNSFIATPGSLSGTGAPYTLTMGNANTIISLAPTDWIDHAGTEADPYPIYTTQQWNLLAERVNNQSQTYSGKFFKLMADITVTESVSSGAPVTMVGISDDNSFQGTFDGNGHTLTLNYNDTRDADFCAPFRYIKNATIQYLHVDGTIYKTKGKNAGGLVGKAVGNNTISNCRSSVDIHFDKDGDVSSGGFIGELRESGGTTFTNCLFDGKLRGANAYKWGGFVGWVASGRTATFNRCLFNPTEIDFDINDGNDNSKTFARHDGTVNVDNCYYTAFLNDAQGATDAHLYLNEPLLAALGLGWETVVENETEKVVPIMSVYPLSGDGTEDSPYLITSTEDWNHLASNQFMGENYNGKYFQLTNNISVTRMVGSDPDHAFQGTFDGGGNTITVSYGTASTPTDIQYCAPFKNTYRATIKNLCTAGTIYTSSTHAGGVVGRNGTENLTMTNVKSSVTINATTSSEACHGGLVGYAINATFEGCVFNGSLLGGNSYGCGGLLGWKAYTDNSNATFTNCLFAPTQVTVGTNNSFTIAKGATDLVTINNCYYTQPLGTEQGTLVHSITPGDYVTIENAGTNPTEYEVSGLTCYSSGILFDEVLYAGNGENLSLNLTCTPPEGYVCNGYQASPGTLTGSDNPYSLTMSDVDVTIYANIEVHWDGEGTEASPYLIYYPVQLDLLATRVNEGNNYSNTYFKVMDNLEYNNTVGNYTTIGYNEERMFNGHFDGQNYTISGINSVTNNQTQCNGLFGYLNTNAVVKNIVLTNTTISDGEDSGGIAGMNKGSVTNCIVTSDVTIQGTIQAALRHGGIVGTNEGSVSHCLFEGELTKTFSYPTSGILSIYAYGGIVGMNSEGATLSDNLAIGATIPQTMHRYGAIAGSNSGTLEHNYYVNCTVAGTENATNVGCYNKISYFEYTLCDVTENDGAVSCPYRSITGHGESGYVLIASPVGDVSPMNVSNMLENTYDLYRFNQAADLEWENYKAVDENGDPLHPDFTTLESGKGYLYANSADVTLVFPGRPYSGSGEVTLSKTGNVSFEGWNLVGNPFAQTAYIDRAYYVMKDDGTEIIAADRENNYVNAMEGIFVVANSDNETMTFSTTQPEVQSQQLVVNVMQNQEASGLRQAQGPATIDRAIVRFGEGQTLPKFQINENSTKLYIPQGGKDYAVATVSTNEMPVNFKAAKDREYTLSFSLENVDLDYLHLIDNMTGADVDLLATSTGSAASYTFTAKTSDYESRFRLVFAADEAVCEPSEAFAFISDGNLIVDGTGTLQVIDMTGRVIFSGDAMNRVSTHGMALGVYVLRLINGDEVKTQKIVMD